MSVIFRCLEHTVRRIDTHIKLCVGFKAHQICIGTLKIPLLWIDMRLTGLPMNSNSTKFKQNSAIYVCTPYSNCAAKFVRLLHKFLMKISELDSHKFLILIKVSLVALECRNHMMFACWNVFFSFNHIPSIIPISLSKTPTQYQMHTHFSMCFFFWWHFVAWIFTLAVFIVPYIAVWKGKCRVYEYDLNMLISFKCWACL